MPSSMEHFQGQDDEEVSAHKQRAHPHPVVLESKADFEAALK